MGLSSSSNRNGRLNLVASFKYICQEAYTTATIMGNNGWGGYPKESDLLSPFLLK